MPSLGFLPRDALFRLFLSRFISRLFEPFHGSLREQLLHRLFCRPLRRRFPWPTHEGLLMEMNLADLVEQFGSDEKCRDYLEQLRWPDGVECPKCESKSISRISTRKQFDCNSCRNRFSVKAGTIFHDSKL